MQQFPIVWLIIGVALGIVIEWFISLRVVRRDLFRSWKQELEGLRRSDAIWRDNVDELNRQLTARGQENAQLAETSRRQRDELEKQLRNETNLERELTHTQARLAELETLAHQAEYELAIPLAKLQTSEMEIARLKGTLEEMDSQRARLISTVEKFATLAASSVPPTELTQPKQVGSSAKGLQIDSTPMINVDKQSIPSKTSPAPATWPQVLSIVRGVGLTYEKRLYAAGIGSYWQLAQLSDSELKRILKLNNHSPGDGHPTAIRREAHRLAQETDSIGTVWQPRPVDNFAEMDGLGTEFRQRLYRAGICTYEAMSNATVETLTSVCRAPAWSEPNFKAWIEQARKLAGKRAMTRSAAEVAS